ncbi:hypothetical protein V7S43_009977 [Phytophthora oleae]|uniref:Uncharacterized protein n=1 Tax=Phytophthora oleae TaxID=2107226 RepID=A0ABD3FEH4_9STRA
MAVRTHGSRISRIDAVQPRGASDVEPCGVRVDYHGVGASRSLNGVVICAMVLTFKPQRCFLLGGTSLYISSRAGACRHLREFQLGGSSDSVCGALKTMLYRKTLRLSARSRQERSTGESSNMYTPDSDSVLQAAFLVHQAWLIRLSFLRFLFGAGLRFDLVNCETESQDLSQTTITLELVLWTHVSFRAALHFARVPDIIGMLAMNRKLYSH